MLSSSSRFADWFFGRVTSVSAELYLRVSGATVTGGCVTGPHSRYAQTLESSAPIVPIDSDGGLWGATLEEPCFWTPRQPFLYTARMEIRDALQPADGIAVTVGVPVLVPRGPRLESAGQNYVLRAMRAESDVRELLPACHATGTALIVNSPDVGVCERASVVGVQLVADLSPLEPAEAKRQLRRVANWPAVGIAVLPAGVVLDSLTRRETAHVVRAQLWQGDSPGSPEDWAQLLVLERDELESTLVEAAADRLGIVVCRKRSSDGSTSDADAQVATARRACDSLQAELAQRFRGGREFAGFLAG